VGEVAQAHDGSLGTAHAYVDAIAAAGGDAVKFQLHLPEAESTRDEPWRVPFSPQDSTRYDYWARTAFTAEQWAHLADHAHERGLALVCSPFSVKAVDLAVGIGTDALKVASGEVSNVDLLDRCADAGVPLLVSSGMSPLSELDDAVARARSAGAPVVVLQCASSYPCPPEEVGLNVLAELATRYGCEVGLSDHSGTIFPGLAAMALGARLLEVHVTLSREAYGPDVSSSVTTSELVQLCEGATWATRMARHPVDKDAAAAGRADLRAVFTRSLVARTDLPAGHVLTDGDLVAKKPAGGLAPGERTAIVGGRLLRSVRADDRIGLDDVEAGPAS
jgi:N-acetylneuraminate synthase